ncbi:MAG: DNA alkylation repair protein, partial [Candidatus Cyclonatronum sp.]|uniref:DNA alkylation repair protein n=1 Tax=Cyclonatronum sp. TaxID=3024185 RepID=UPI0025C669F4
MSLFDTPDYQWVKGFMLELEQKADPSYKKAMADKFRLDMSDALGIPAPEIRAIAKQHQPNFNRLTAAQQTELCDLLLTEGLYEYRISCFHWLKAQKKHWTAAHLPVFERWLKEHISGWPDCDDFCASVLGEFFLIHPTHTGNCLSWSASPNPMVRRAGLVALIKPAKKAGRLYPALMQCDASLHDEDVLVQKA